MTKPDGWYANEDQSGQQIAESRARRIWRRLSSGWLRGLFSWLPF